MLLLTQKIKAGGKVYENGSRQTIAAIEGHKLRNAGRKRGLNGASRIAQPEWRWDEDRCTGSSPVGVPLEQDTVALMSPQK